MSRQGNYVTVPGGSTNWTEGISKSLLDLSKSYRDQAINKAETARLREKDAREAEKFELERAILGQELSDKNILTNVAPNVGIEALGPNVQNNRSKLLDRRNKLDEVFKENKKYIETNRGLFDDKGALTDFGQNQLVELTKQAQRENPDITPDNANRVAREYLDAVYTNVTSPEADKYLTSKSNYLKNYDRAILDEDARASGQMTRGEYIEGRIQELTGAGHSGARSKEVLSILETEADARGLLTRAEMVEQAQERENQAYKERKDQLDILIRGMRANNSGGTKTGSAKNGMDAREFTQAISDLDRTFLGLGWQTDEKKTGEEAFTTIIESYAPDEQRGMAPFVRAAIIDSIVDKSEGFFTGEQEILDGASLSSRTGEKWINRVKNLAAQYQADSGGSRRQQFLTDKALQLEGSRTITPEEVLGRRYAREITRQSPPEFKRLTFTVQREALENITNKASPGDTPPPLPPPPRPPQQNPPGAATPLVASPNSGIPNDLRAILGNVPDDVRDKLDVDWDVSSTSRGRRMKLSEKEKNTREYLNRLKRILELENSYAENNDPRTKALLDNTRRAQNALEKRLK